MARARHHLLDVDVAVAEGSPRLGLAARESPRDLIEMMDRAGAAATAAGDRLDHHRAARAERREELAGFVERGRPQGPAHHGHAAALGQRARARLVAEEFEDLRPRTDERDSLRGAMSRERGVLAQEAVARMDRVASSGACRGDKLLAVEIRGRASTAQRARLVSLAGVE